MSDMRKGIGLLKYLVKESNNIVFFGGAGVSTESGIPDFRSTKGLYNQAYKYPPEVILSYDFFISNTKEFYRFYKDKMVMKNIKPNQAHIALARLEEENKLKAVITQNIDGLHQLAGSKNVLELHGSVHNNNCVDCAKFYGIEIISGDGVPTCECGGIVKPDVVLYGEQLDNDTMHKAINHIARADMLVVGGTSLSVYPAAGFIDYYSGDKLVLINHSKTDFDIRANLLIRGNIGNVLGECVLQP